MVQNNAIKNEIFECCGQVMNSDLMEEAKGQVHHRCTTLYDHIMRVVTYAIEFCNEYEKSGIKVDRQCVVTAALCHDLGIVGRYRKFKSDPEAWFKHAELSVTETKNVLPDVDTKALKAIEKHMWPISFIPPTNIEEWIVIAADKKASAYEFFNRNKLRAKMCI